RRNSALLVLCVIGAPFLFFLVTRVGSGIASPESRHLIFALPFFALLLATALVELARTRAGVAAAALALVALCAGEVLWGLNKTRPLYAGEPAARVSARDAASAWLASTARPDDVLFGYDPLYLGDSDINLLTVERALGLRGLDGAARR